MEQLIEELKNKIITTLNLEEMSADEIDAEAPLFNEGLGLDSIDVLELIMLLERDYGIRLKSAAEGKEIFKSVAVMAKYVAEHRTK